MSRTYAEVSVTTVRPLAERLLQRILDSQAEEKKQYFVDRYENYAFWRRFWPFGRILSFDEYVENFNPNSLSISESFEYCFVGCRGEERAENLRAILGLCELAQSGTVNLSTQDAVVLGYPTKENIPLPTEEREKIIAERELQSVLA